MITKQDYIRFADRFAALSGIVQSMLLTRHLLFVGFSFDDDNFQRIFDSVRKARLPKPMRNGHGILGSVKEVYRAAINGSKEGREDVDVKGVCGTAIMLEHSYLKVSPAAGCVVMCAGRAVGWGYMHGFSPEPR